MKEVKYMSYAKPMVKKISLVAEQAVMVSCLEAVAGQQTGLEGFAEGWCGKFKGTAALCQNTY